MGVYKQFNTNEVVISPFKANKRFRFENNQVTSSDVQIEYYQSEQGTYLSGSFPTGFNTMQDGVTVFNSVKQLYYSNYLTSSWGDPMVTGSFIAGRTDPQGNSLGFDQIVGNTTGPRFENFLQSSLQQDRKFAQFSASAAPIGFAGTNTGVSESFFQNIYNGNISSTELSFVIPPLVGGLPNVDSLILSHVEWRLADILNSPFTLTAGGTQITTVSASQLVEERINPDVNGTLSGLTLKNNDLVTFINDGSVGDLISFTYIQKPRGPSVISIPSMLYGEAIQPSSFQFEYTSSINFTRSIVDDDGQGNLIVTQSNSTGVPFFSGSVGQIFYSQGIAVITGPDSGSLREFAHNVGYKDNMNPNIMSSSLSYSSSVTIDENQYKCTVRDSEFEFTTNPSALGAPGELTKTNNQLFNSFDAGTLNSLSNNTYVIQPQSFMGNNKATTAYIFGGGSATTIGQQCRVQLESSNGITLEFVGYDGNWNGTRNGLNQVQFNSTGSAAGIAANFADAVNSVNGFNGEISASLQTEISTNDTVLLTQIQAGSAGNTRIKYSDNFFNILSTIQIPTPPRGQENFGYGLDATDGSITGDEIYSYNPNGALLNVVVAGNSVISINVSSSTSTGVTVAEEFAGRGYKIGDTLAIQGSQLGGSGIGYINLTLADVEKDSNSQVYHDFVTGSDFSPYVTTVGLYNANHDLIVVGKFPRPLPISTYTDTTYMINFDTN
jgi:hypothetical protein